MPIPLIGPALAGLKGAASWLVPAVLGAGGQLSANKANRQMSRDQMAFQERMSSTAAQRSQADYRAAGLNPSLAYGTTASSPGGSMAHADNVGEKGVSSALAARSAAATVENMQEQNQLLRTQNQVANAEAVVAMAKAAPWMNDQPGSLRHLSWEAQREGLVTDIATARQQRALQPHDLRLRSLEAAIRGTQLPRAELLESGFRAAGGVRDFITKGLSSSQAAADAFKAWAEAGMSNARFVKNRATTSTQRNR